MRKVDSLVLNGAEFAKLTIQRPQAPATITLHENYENDRLTFDVPADWFVDDVKVKNGRKIIKFRKYNNDLESDTHSATSL